PTAQCEQRRLHMLVTVTSTLDSTAWWGDGRWASGSHGSRIKGSPPSFDAPSRVYFITRRKGAPVSGPGIGRLFRRDGLRGRRRGSVRRGGRAGRGVERRVFGRGRTGAVRGGRLRGRLRHGRRRRSPLRRVGRRVRGRVAP